MMRNPFNRATAIAGAVLLSALAISPVLPAADVSSMGVEAGRVGAVQAYTTEQLPEGASSTAYEVSVGGADATVYQSAPPEIGDCSRSNCDGGDLNRLQNRTFNWSTIGFERGANPVVTVRRVDDVAGRGADGVRILGDESAFKILSTDLSAESVTLRLLKPGVKLSVEFQDERWDSLRQIPLDAMLLFSGDLETPLPQSTSTYVVEAGEDLDPSRLQTAQALVFEPGVHDVGYFRLPPQLLHVRIEGGAYVLGAIDASQADTEASEPFVLDGNGVLSGEQIPWHASKSSGGTTPCAPTEVRHLCAVKLVDLANKQFTITDVTLANSPFYTMTGDSEIGGPATRGSEIHNVNVLGSWRYNNDGLAALEGTTITDSFVSAFDDAYKLYSSDARIENNIVWQMDNGSVFQLGWYVKDVSDVVVRNIDVWHAEWSGYNANVGVINYRERTGDISGSFTDITFENIRVLGPVPRAIAISNTSVEQAFDNITIVDLHVDHIFTAEEMLQLEGNGPKSGGPINRLAQDLAAMEISFKRLTIDGHRITEDNVFDVGQFQIEGAPEVSFR